MVIPPYVLIICVVWGVLAYLEPEQKNIIILGGCRYWQYFKSTKLNLPFLGVSNSDNEAFEEKGEVMASIVTLLAWINRPCLGWHWKYLKRDRVTIVAHKHVEVTQKAKQILHKVQAVIAPQTSPVICYDTIILAIGFIQLNTSPDTLSKLRKSDEPKRTMLLIVH